VPQPNAVPSKMARRLQISGLICGTPTCAGTPGHEM
jgi:hypothetical protein